MPDNNVYTLARLSALKGPSEQSLDFLQSWLEHPSRGAFPLFGIDGDSWEPRNERDLISLKPEKPSDLFSKWLSDTLIPSYHRNIGRRSKRPVSPELGGGMFEYSDKTIRQTTRFVSTTLASVIPLLSVAILYTVRSNILRLGIITVLSTLFSVTVSLTTNARGIEVFAATSAYVMRPAASVHD
jgi:hypothetical protein